MLCFSHCFHLHSVDLTDAERRANAGGQGFASSLFQAARGVSVDSSMILPNRGT